MVPGLFSEFTRFKPRQMISQILNYGTIVSLAVMIWKTLVYFSDSECPIVVVLSGSMEPAFHRGDLLFISHNWSKPVESGDINVFRIVNREIPIVHRTVVSHANSPEDWMILTKGDNNNVHDRGLYEVGENWVYPKEVMGKIQGTAPFVGMLTILMSDYPALKYVLLGSMTLWIIIFRE
ncbi:Signal peptidase complex catalytic subunit SEC11C [Thelohanellus kitauei]|uniref:Signal peptidase complex catalytic subunit SEC11 n=1 Tax=Thelohanellus kitauei TaxID=669202 RepID=A0A0C2MJB5_THEKT|nr:Signal peptidase complex catalytic subunit SEC11C [Thelohanellus kitauei]